MSPTASRAPLVQPGFPERRQAGVSLPISALPGRFGIGEIGRRARQFIEEMIQMQLGVWQFLPAGPTAFGDSPYQPLSTFAGNENLIAIDDLMERGLLAAKDVRGLEGLPASCVDFEALIPAKTRVLQLAATRFATQADASSKAAFDAFVDRHDRSWLHDYALFRVLKTEHDQRPWPEWAPRYVHRDKPALHAIEVSQSGRIQTLKILQFLFFEQWRALKKSANDRGIRLFGDMPIYIALDSADAWSRPELLRIDADGRPDRVAGVPPDYFSDDGQLWGNPLYAWDEHEATGFGWWIDRLRTASEMTDIVRIDHFRGFEAFWSVPAGSKTAREGRWEPGPGDAIFDAMRDAIGELPIVAENLGVITPAVDALLERQQFPGMTVLQFSTADPEFDIAAVAANSVCYTGTHDNDTTLGWFDGSPNGKRSAEEMEQTRQAALQLTKGKPETIHTDLIRAAFSSPALIAIAPLQDYLGLGSEARINTPGTAGNNWRWRVRNEQLSAEFKAGVADLVISSGRALSN